MTNEPRGKTMSSKSGRRALVIFSVVLLSGCTVFSEKIVRPPAPEPLPTVQPPPTSLPQSLISVPIRLDLSAVLRQTNDETVVPKKFDHWGTYIKSTKGADYKYYAELDHFAFESSRPAPSIVVDTGRGLRDWWGGIAPHGSSVLMTAPLRYKVGANPHAHTAGLPVQCGEGSEWPRRATLDGNVGLGITPKYDVAASLVGVAVKYVDRCAIQLADFDPAQEAIQRVTDGVRGGLSRAVAPISALTVRPQMEQAWNALRAPIQLEQDMWLQLNTGKVGQSGEFKGGPVVESEMQVVANPVIVLGSEPVAMAATLPPLDTQPVAPGFHVASDVRLEYAALSEMLTNRLKGKQIQFKGDVIRINNATISDHGGNRVVVRIDFNGEAYGHAYMIGKPGMNVLTQTVFIGDLRWDDATEKVLLEVASWLHNASFRELVGDHSVFGVTPSTDRIKGLLTAALNRSLSPTVSLRGNVESVQGVNVFAAADGLHVQAMSEGTVSVAVGERN